MAKVKLTKTAQKKERDNLKQYLRFLPTLQLKKQQLQMEMRQCQDPRQSVRQKPAGRNRWRKRSGNLAASRFVNGAGAAQDAVAALSVWM